MDETPLEMPPAETPADTSAPQREPLLEWSAPTHPVHERSPQWYVFASVAIVALIVFGILSGNWTMSLLSALIGGVYYLTHRHPPVIRHIAIEETGFAFGDHYYHWDECVDFWIVRTPRYGELHILKRKGFDKELIVQTGDIDQTVIRATLSRFLPIRPDQAERFVDMFIRICKL